MRDRDEALGDRARPRRSARRPATARRAASGRRRRCPRAIASSNAKAGIAPGPMIVASPICVGSASPRFDGHVPAADRVARAGRVVARRAVGLEQLPAALEVAAARDLRDSGPAPSDATYATSAWISSSPKRRRLAHGRLAGRRQRHPARCAGRSPPRRPRRRPALARHCRPGPRPVARGAVGGVQPATRLHDRAIGRREAGRRQPPARRAARARTPTRPSRRPSRPPARRAREAPGPTRHAGVAAHAPVTAWVPWRRCPPSPRSTVARRGHRRPRGRRDGRGAPAAIGVVRGRRVARPADPRAPRRRGRRAAARSGGRHRPRRGPADGLHLVYAMVALLAVPVTRLVAYARGSRGWAGGWSRAGSSRWGPSFGSGRPGARPRRSDVRHRGTPARATDRGGPGRRRVRSGGDPAGRARGRTGGARPRRSSSRRGPAGARGGGRRASLPRGADRPAHARARDRWCRRWLGGARPGGTPGRSAGWGSCMAAASWARRRRHGPGTERRHAEAARRVPAGHRRLQRGCTARGCNARCDGVGVGMTAGA